MNTPLVVSVAVVGLEKQWLVQSGNGNLDCWNTWYVCTSSGDDEMELLLNAWYSS